LSSVSAASTHGSAKGSRKRPPAVIAGEGRQPITHTIFTQRSPQNSPFSALDLRSSHGSRGRLAGGACRIRRAPALQRTPSFPLLVVQWARFDFELLDESVEVLAGRVIRIK
jgi:hypothetical protein